MVVDRDSNLAVLGATVWVRGTGGPILTWEGTTDEEGRYTIVPQSDATRWFDVLIATPGYAPHSLATAINPNSPSYTVRLQRAASIGGVVRDERERPIHGARVLPMRGRFAAIWPEIAASPNSGRAWAATDSEGRWRAMALPVGTAPGETLHIRVTHPDHVTVESQATAREARAFSVVQVMRPGVSISGTVLSPFGRPVREAAVAIAASPWDGTALRLTTDQAGRFRSSRCLDPKSPGAVVLVYAFGLAWAVHHVALAPEIPEQVIRLSRRRPLEGRVNDAQGQPVEGAVVTSSREVFGGLLGWEATTDANGHFIWYDAPTTGKLYLDVFKRAFQSTGCAIARPSADLVTITLRH
jgi:hypothetical protein